MARLKRDHSGYRSFGLYEKYQQPSVNEQPPKHKSKKNTSKWCRGKVGEEHQLYRYFYHSGWNGKRTSWVRSSCKKCRKEFNTKRTDIPLHIEIDESNHGIKFPVQVKIDGKALPLDYRLFKEASYYCWQCEEWHSKY